MTERAIDKVRKHWENRIGQALQHHHVEEWGLDVYFRPVTSLKVESQIVELTTQGKTVEALVEAIILKCLDKEGNPIFGRHDKNVLLREADPNVVLTLARVVNGSDLPSVEDLEKNS